MPMKQLEVFGEEQHYTPRDSIERSQKVSKPPNLASAISESKVPSVPVGVPRSEKHGARNQRFARALAALRNSAWMPVATRSVGAVLLMAGLAAVGAASVAQEPRAVVMADGLGVTGPSTWLKPTESDSASARASMPASPTPARTHPTPAQDAAGEQPEEDCDKEVKAAPNASAGLTSDGKVILNTAGPAELTRLPGVGEKRAVAIIKLRERLKRFRRPTDLLRVRGIGVKTLKKMLPLLVLDPPEQDAESVAATASEADSS